MRLKTKNKDIEISIKTLDNILNQLEGKYYFDAELIPAKNIIYLYLTPLNWKSKTKWIIYDLESMEKELVLGLIKNFDIVF